MNKKLIGIYFANEEPVGISRLNLENKHCHFIGRARTEEAFYVSVDNISCPLARFYLGIGKSRLKDLAKTLVGWSDAVDEKTALKYLNSALCVKKEIKYMIYFAYPHSRLKPDILIKIDNPENIQALIQKFSARTGERVNASLSGIGAACGECAAYPLVTGKANLSVGCYGSRPGINLNLQELLLVAPYDSKMGKILIGT